MWPGLDSIPCYSKIQATGWWMHPWSQLCAVSSAIPCLPVPRTEQVPSKCCFKWAKFWASVFPLSFDILLLVQIRQGPVWLWPSLRGLCFGPGYSDQALLLECLITNRNVVLTVVEAQVHSQGTGRCWAWWNLTPTPESYLCTVSGMIHPFLMSSSLKM